MDEENKRNYKIFRRQPILCPWITTQPYHSSLWSRNSQNRSPTTLPNDFSHNPWERSTLPTFRAHDSNPVPTIQQSSSQFFFFLRLMQLFPETHPATLHSVLSLCKNDFYSAVDKLLYAKRCKLLCYKKNLLMQKLPQPCKKSSTVNNHGHCSNDNSSQNRPVVKAEWHGERQLVLVKAQNNGSLNLSINNNQCNNVNKKEKILDNDEIVPTNSAEPSGPRPRTRDVITNSLVDKAEDLSAINKINNEEQILHVT